MDLDALLPSVVQIANTRRSDFHISGLNGQSDVMVVIDDHAFRSNDFFIRDFYKAFSKRVSCFPLDIGVVQQAFGDSKWDRQKDLVMPGGRGRLTWLQS